MEFSLLEIHICFSLIFLNKKITSLHTWGGGGGGGTHEETEMMLGDGVVSIVIFIFLFMAGIQDRLLVSLIATPLYFHDCRTASFIARISYIWIY
ncbi:hypothetical protein ACJX0J_024242, partial [Zea mays]